MLYRLTEIFINYQYGVAMNGLTAIGGAGIDSFLPATAAFNELKRIIQAQSIVWPFAPIWVVGIQGETDAQSEVLANAWGSKMTTIADALEDQTGRSDLYYLDTYLADDLTAEGFDYVAEVNASKDTFTRPGNRVHRLNPSGHGGMNPDNLHWNDARGAWWESASDALIRSVA